MRLPSPRAAGVGVHLHLLEEVLVELGCMSVRRVSTNRTCTAMKQE